MNNLFQATIAASYIRGGTSKGIFFKQEDLPEAAQLPGPIRDQILLGVVGSPDPYGKQIDGMGGGSSSTSKVVILSKSTRKDHDIDYLFGQVAIDQAVIDWSGNCGNLTAAVGLFALTSGLLDKNTLPASGVFQVRIWQVNIRKTIIAHIPIVNHKPQEVGDFILDGVTFPAPEIKIDFVEPGVRGGALFPTGKLVERLEVLGIGIFNATLIDAGIPTVFLNAHELGYQGTELQEAINSDARELHKFECIRIQAALKMGLAATPEDVKQHTPKIAFLAPAKSYVTSSGKIVDADQIDLVVRALSMEKLHHAMMGTVAVAIGSAAVIPGTLVNLAAGGRVRESVTFGHPSGILKVGAIAQVLDQSWTVRVVSMSRSARILMQGNVWLPSPSIFE